MLTTYYDYETEYIKHYLSKYIDIFLIRSLPSRLGSSKSYKYLNNNDSNSSNLINHLMIDTLYIYDIEMK